MIIDTAKVKEKHSFKPRERNDRNLTPMKPRRIPKCLDQKDENRYKGHDTHGRFNSNKKYDNERIFRKDSRL